MMMMGAVGNASLLGMAFSVAVGRLILAVIIVGS